MNDKCWAKYVEMYLDIKKDGEIYVYFSFCCEQQIRIAEYPIEYLCNNLDKCYNEVLDKAADLQICYDCHKYDGFDIYDKSLFSLQNGTHHICSQGCKFCGIVITGKRIKDPKYRWCSNKILEAVSKSKTIEKFAPSVSGEPFEDPYIKNEFLFNLHNSNIKTITFLTNATRLVDKDYLIKLRDYLEEHKITYTFVINLSGFDKETYESYCNTKFDRIQKCINNINDVFHDWFLNIHYIIGKHNCKLSRKYVEEEFLKNFSPNLLNRVQYCFDFNVHRYLNSEEYDKLVKEYLTDERSFFDNIQTKVLN